MKASCGVGVVALAIGLLGLRFNSSPDGLSLAFDGLRQRSPRAGCKGTWASSKGLTLKATCILVKKEEKIM